MIREPLGVHGVWVNGVRVRDEHGYCDVKHGPGHVIRKYG
jgi:hypothetical protein